VFLGVDIGSLSAKAVLIDHQGRILDQRVFFTGASSRKTAAKLEAVVKEGGWVQRFKACVATGYGRAAVSFSSLCTVFAESEAEVVRHLKKLPGPRIVLPG